jgi:hypothetical protein
MRRLLPIALGFALLVFAAPAGASGPPVPDLRWRDCDGGFECATAKVPLDYDHPYGAKVRLAVVRHRARDAEHRIGSLFLNPGGPGESAVDFVRTAPPPAFQLLTAITQFNPCTLGAVIPYLDELALPPKGESCDQVVTARAARRASPAAPWRR